MSAKTGKKVTIVREFEDGYRMTVLPTPKNEKNPVVHLATQDKNGRNFIIKYDMDGNKLGKYELPIRNNGLLLDTNLGRCAFIPEQSKFLYRNYGIDSYVLGEKNPKNLISFGLFETPVGIIPITQKIVMVQTNLFYYTIDTETGKILSKIFINRNNTFKCVDFENKRMLILEEVSPGSYKYAMNVYDIFTGELLNHVMDNPNKIYEAVFYKDKIVYEESDRIFIVDINGKTPPVLLFSGKDDEKNYYELSGLLPDDKICIRHNDYSFFGRNHLIIFDLVERKEVKRFNEIYQVGGVRIWGEYIIYEI